MPHLKQKNTKKQLAIFSFCLILILLTGCAKQKQVNINNQKSEPVDKSEDKKNNTNTAENETGNIETNTKTTDDINKNQNKNEATENKKEFELNSDFVSSVLIMKAFAGDGDEVKIKSLDKSGIFHDIKEYNRMLPRGLSSLNYLNYEPTIFMSGIGENGYTTIDLSGKETSADHIFLKDKKFSEENFIKFPNEDKIVYTLESYNQGESKSVFIFDYKKNDIDYIESDILSNSPGSSRVVGLSKDKQFIYITRIGWEGYEYAGLWKVNIKTKNIDKITGAEKVTLGELNVVPYLDLAVGIESREITNDNSDVYNIMAGPPSKLNIFDLKTNNYKTLLTSNNSVLSSPILSPSGNKIFYNEENSNNLYTINTDGSNKKLIAKNANLQGVSRNGEKIIIKLVAENIFKILDLEKNSEEIITFSELTNETKAEFLLCNYPLGYSCLY
ncbi:MAG: hypothetical protein V1688_03710 [bacterium]